MMKSTHLVCSFFFVFSNEDCQIALLVIDFLVRGYNESKDRKTQAN